MTEDFVSVSFYDDLHGCIVSMTGTVLMTMDGGQNWNLHAFPEYHFESVHFVTANQGCIVGWHVNPQDSSLILLTTDGGNNWSECGHPKVKRLNDVYFHSNTHGWTVGVREDLEVNTFFHTNDAGLIWHMQSSPLVAEAELSGVHFWDQNNGTALYTTNN